MKNYGALRHGLVIASSCALVISCGKPDPGARARDPNTPAVVQLPPFVDTGKVKQITETQPELIASGEAVRTLSQNYALLGAGLVFGDRRMVARWYAPDAELITPDVTFKGAAAIANGFGGTGVQKSLKAFNRSSRRLTLVDSTVIDSGTYIVLTKRAGADSVLERGNYASTWRLHPFPMNWVITKDHLYRGAGSKAGSKKAR